MNFDINCEYLANYIASDFEDILKSKVDSLL